MLVYFCPLCASNFSINYVDMQKKYADMQDINVNMHHNYFDYVFLSYISNAR